MSGKDTTYNGWANYETWVVALWMDNEQGTQEYYHDLARRQLALPAKYPTHHIADQIKEEYEEAMPEVTGVWADMLNASLSRVNWDEIARNLVSAVTES